jgi:hypothetical protein
MKQVELNHEAVDDIITSELKEAILWIVNQPGADPYDDPYLPSLLGTLDYFLGDAEFKRFKAENPHIPEPVSDWDMAIDDITENPDGTCDMQYRAGAKLKEHLVGVGLQKVLNEAADHVLSAED